MTSARARQEMVALASLCVTCGRGVLLPHADWCEGIKNRSRKFTVTCPECSTAYTPTVGGSNLTGCPTCQRSRPERPSCNLRYVGNPDWRCHRMATSTVKSSAGVFVSACGEHAHEAVRQGWTREPL